jgi:hypothetical protein
MSMHICGTVSYQGPTLSMPESQGYRTRPVRPERACDHWLDTNIGRYHLARQASEGTRSALPSRMQKKSVWRKEIEVSGVAYEVGWGVCKAQYRGSGDMRRCERRVRKGEGDDVYSLLRAYVCTYAVT